MVYGKMCWRHPSRWGRLQSSGVGVGKMAHNMDFGTLEQKTIADLVSVLGRLCFSLCCLGITAAIFGAYLQLDSCGRRQRRASYTKGAIRLSLLFWKQMLELKQIQKVDMRPVKEREVPVHNSSCVADRWDMGLPQERQSRRSAGARGLGYSVLRLTLEPPPPDSSFATHQQPEPWDVQHTRLIDGRWADLFMSHLRDVADYQEKRSKLTAPREDRPVPKVKAKGGRKGKDNQEEKPPTGQI